MSRSAMHLAASLSFRASAPIRKDRRLVSWGYDGFGQVSGTPKVGTYSTISAGGFHTVAIRSDGALVSWGYDYAGAVSRTPSTGTYSAVSAGYAYSVAIVVLTPSQAIAVLKQNV